VAQRCFVDDEANALMRLFEWMDSSKGRVVFAARHPGHMPDGALKFRISPERPVVTNTVVETSRRVEPRKQSTSTRSSSMPVSAPSRKSNASPELESVRGDSHVKGTDISYRVDTDVRRMVQQVFGHYTAIGDPLNRTSLSTLKYMRFLRDCGLVSNEVRGSPKEFQFAPGERMRKSRSSSRPELVKAHVANPSFRGRQQRQSTDAFGRRGSGRSDAEPPSNTTRTSQTFTVSPSKLGNESSANENGLPLRIFPVPIITQVEADLIFLSATRAENQIENATKRNSNSSVGANGKRGSVSAKRHHMTCDSFVFALQDIASRCFPAEGQFAFEYFCEHVLAPLSDALLEVKGQDLARAAEAMADPEVVQLLARCCPGLEKIYLHYVEENAGRRACWTKEAMIRFAEDFDFLAEVNNLPLQKIFRDCTHHESLNGKGVAGEMSFSSFQLALVMISQKLHFSGDTGDDPTKRISLLFNRLNTIAGAYGNAGILRSSESPLIPGLPSPNLARRSNSGLNQDRLSGFRSDRRASASDMSWEAMMRDAET